MSSGDANGQVQTLEHSRLSRPTGLTFWNLGLWLLGRRTRLRVDGDSMQPSLKPGEEVLVDLKCYDSGMPQVGDLVYLQHPLRSDTLMFKRIASIEDDGRFTVLGDNPGASSDSRHFGRVAKENIKGKVICTFP